jgi:hypothetical protein
MFSEQFLHSITLVAMLINSELVLYIEGNNSTCTCHVAINDDIPRQRI